MPIAASAPGPPVPHYAVLDTAVDAFTSDEFLDYIAEATRRPAQTLIANHNVNSLALHRRSPAFRDFYDRADAIFIDGMPVVAIARMLGHDVTADHRIGVLDWIWPFAARAEAEGWHVVHVGGRDAVRHRGKAALRERHPDLRLTTISGYFDAAPGAAGTRAVVERIRASDPDVLLLGMGMPRQEEWALANLDALPSCPIVTVGGIFGYLAGERPTPPRWLGPMGLEWAYRLATEPRRLWRRYLLEPGVLVGPVLQASAHAHLHER